MSTDRLLESSPTGAGARHAVRRPSSGRKPTFPGRLALAAAATPLMAALLVAALWRETGGTWNIAVLAAPTAQREIVRAAAAMDALRRQQEREMEAKLVRILDGAVGAGNARVAVALTLDWGEEERTTERVVEQRVRRRQDTRESLPVGTSGAAVVVGAAASGDGRASSATNVPAFAPSSGADYVNRSEVVEEYDNPIERVRTLRRPGEIKTVSVSVLLAHGGAGRANLDDVAQIISAAIAVQPTRGDHISVVSAPTTEIDETLPNSLAVGLVAAAGGLALGLGLNRFFRRLKSSRSSEHPAGDPLAGASATR